MNRFRPKPRIFAGALAFGLMATLLTAPDALAVTTITNPHATGDGIVRADGRAAGLAGGDRQAASRTVAGRTVTLHISDTDQMGWASLSGGQSGDAVWLNRSFDGFKTREPGELAYTAAQADGTAVTGMINDANEATGTVGELWACMSVNGDPYCTAAARSTTSTVFAGVEGLDPYFSAATGLFDVDPTGTQPVKDNGDPWWTKWWHSAVATSALVGAAEATDDTRYDALIDQIYTKNVTKDVDGLGDNFRNKFIDDTGWWAMAWIDAYRRTGLVKYLDSAKVAAQFMTDHTSTACGGGVYWHVDETYHAAISNSLYLQVVSALYQETGDSVYLTRAQTQWNWYRTSGLIGSDGLVNDGMGESTCTVGTGSAHYTYNQGALLSALTEYYQATADSSVITTARQVADAFTSDATLSKDGIMRDTCEANTNVDNNQLFGYACKNDGPVFKGPAVRGLSELNALLADHPYTTYLGNQVTAALANSRDLAVAPGTDQYGLRWYDSGAAKRHIGNQIAAVMLLNATYVRPADNGETPLPAVTIATASSPTGTAGWFTSPVTVTMTAAASLPSGAKIEYSIDGGPWTDYTVPLAISASGTVNARTTYDAEHHSVLSYLDVKIDLDDPVVHAAVNTASRTVTLTGTDATSGVATVEVQIDGGAWIAYAGPITVGSARSTIGYRATDRAGRTSGVASVTLPGEGEYPYPTVTTTTVSPARTSYGRAAQVSVSVRNASTTLTDIPTGTVTVREGSRVVATGRLAGGKATFALSKTLAVGTHRLTVTYSGDGSAKASSATASVAVIKAQATVKATGKKRIKKKTKPTYRVTVTSQTGTKATGKVVVTLRKVTTTAKKKTRVSAKKTSSRTVKLSASGRATVKLPRAKRGTYRVTVAYRGSSTLATTSVTKKLTIR